MGLVGRRTLDIVVCGIDRCDHSPQVNDVIATQKDRIRVETRDFMGYVVVHVMVSVPRALRSVFRVMTVIDPG